MGIHNSTRVPAGAPDSVCKSLITTCAPLALSLFSKSRRSCVSFVPMVEIDNNPVENAIRPVALGRKNYLFAGSHEAAQR